MNSIAPIPVEVVRRSVIADDVIELVLAGEDGTELPEWRPGAHIDVMMDPALTRQYSLCGDPGERRRYRIAILKEVEGRGGSRYLHENIEVGRQLHIRGPRNHFPLERSPEYLFIAGGIGITPLVPMIQRVAASGASWQLHYGGRNRASMAFTAELLRTDPQRVRLLPFDECGLIDIEAALDTIAADALVYVCGPEPLILAVEAACARRGQPFRIERFSPKEAAPPSADTAFTVELASTGLKLTVPADRSVIDVLLDADVDILTSCEEGTCGTCETGVLSGRPDHRDSVLTEDERAACDRMMVCVSRALTAELVLDL